MIDHGARTQLAEAIRALASGLITNDQFESRVPESADPAVREVFSQGAWYLYGDLSTYRLAGRHRLPNRARADVARWLLFLKSERPYEWPVLGPLRALILIGLSVCTLGPSGVIYRRFLARRGSVALWPFYQSGHYEEALRHAPYLRGAA